MSDYGWMVKNKEEEIIIQDVSQHDKQIRVKDLIKALYKELEVENLNLLEVEKALLVEFMACDIIRREGYLPHFDPPIINQWYQLRF